LRFQVPFWTKPTVPASIPTQGAENLLVANEHHKEENTREKSGQVGKYPESAGFLLAILKRQCCGEDVPRPVKAKNNEEFGEAAKVGHNVLPSGPSPVPADHQVSNRETQ